MLTLTKYEFRKNRTFLMVIGIFFLLLEGYFLFSIFCKTEDHTIVSAFLLYLFSMLCFFLIFILFITNYSKELNSKSSYLIFMTPNSALNIILSKLLCSFIIAIGCTAVFFGVLYLDTKLVLHTYTEIDTVKSFLMNMLELSDFPIRNYLLYGLTLLIEMIISFFSSVTLIYLSITLSVTLFQNNRFHNFISFGFFLLLTYLVNRVREFLPVIYTDSIEDLSMQKMMLNLLPNTLLDLCFIILCIFACERLLEKKLSL